MQGLVRSRSRSLTVSGSTRSTISSAPSRSRRGRRRDRRRSRRSTSICPRSTMSMARSSCRALRKAMPWPATCGSLNLQGNAPVIGGFVRAKKGQADIRHRGGQDHDHRAAREPARGFAQRLGQGAQKDNQEGAPSCAAGFVPARGETGQVDPKSFVDCRAGEVDGTKLLLTGDAHGERRRQGLEGTRSRDRSGHDRFFENAAPRQHPEHDRGLSQHSSSQTTTSFPRMASTTILTRRRSKPWSKMHGQRKIVLHFTNEDVKWKKAVNLEKNKKAVRTLNELLAALHAAIRGHGRRTARRTTFGRREACVTERSFCFLPYSGEMMSIYTPVTMDFGSAY